MQQYLRICNISKRMSFDVEIEQDYRNALVERKLSTRLLHQLELVPALQPCHTVR